MSHFTKSQVIRKNLSYAADALNAFGYKTGAIKVKAFGQGIINASVDGTSFDENVEESEVFEGWKMEKLVQDFILSVVDTLDEETHWNVLGERLMVGNFDRVYPKKFIHCVDCRMFNYDEDTVCNFWAEDAKGSVPNSINEMIGDLPLAVFHRKGKDWYIASRVERFSSEIYVLDAGEKGLEYYGELTGNLKYFVSDEMNAVASKLKQHIEMIKDGLELHCLTEKFASKILTMNPFLEKDLNRKDILFPVYQALEEIYRNKSVNRLFDGFHGAFADLSDGDDFVNVASFLDLFKRQPELSIVNAKDLIKLSERLGLEARFEFSYQFEVSVVFRTPESYVIHVSPEEFSDCNRDWSQTLRKKVLPLWKKRIEIDALSSLKKQIGRDLNGYARKVWVRFEDSLKSGNCLSGSLGFCNRNNIDLGRLGAIRGDWLLEMEDTEYTRRVIYSLLNQKPGLVGGVE